MRILRLIPLLGITVHTGCALMDTSFTDNAIPIKANHVQITPYRTWGWDPFSVIGEKPDTLGMGSVPRSDKPIGSMLDGIQASIGLGKNMELGGKICNIWNDDFSDKLYLKIRFYHPNESISTAIIPTFGVQNGKGEKPLHIDLSMEGDMPKPPQIDYKYTAVNYELPILYSITVKKRIPTVSTFALRWCLDHTSITYDDYLSVWGSNPDARHIRGKNSFRMGTFYELDILDKRNNPVLFISGGCDFCGLFTGEAVLLPTCSIGFRLNLYSHKQKENS